MYVVISCSLNRSSRSRSLAARAFQSLQDEGHPAEWIDLRDLDLPPCDGSTCYENETVQQLSRTVREATGVLIAAPVYNYGLSASAKNLVELTGDAWREPVVGFLCAAGGRASYMAVMGLANSLMLDFRTFILPRFVYASKTSFRDAELDDVDVQQRIRNLTRELARVASALRNR